MNDWLAALDQQLRVHQALVRVVVARVQGSAPREPGATMLVVPGDASASVGSIGGGHLEWQAIRIANSMLNGAARTTNRLDRFVLGATLGQCCGGVVELWFERFDADDARFIADALTLRQHDASALMLAALRGEPRLRVLTRAAASAAGLYTMATAQPTQLVSVGAESLLLQALTPSTQTVWLFGAGHVGQALVRLLADLPFRVRWIDSRDAAFPASVPDNVSTRHEDDPADAVADAPPDALFLVMTHSHDLDYAICRALLVRAELAGAGPTWVGLIGSRSKARQFSQRLLRHGVAPEYAARLTCPIGVPGIASKLPAAIALSVAAQLLEVGERLSHSTPDQAGLRRTRP